MDPPHPPPYPPQLSGATLLIAGLMCRSLLTCSWYVEVSLPRLLSSFYSLTLLSLPPPSPLPHQMSTLPGFHYSYFQNKSNIFYISNSCAPYVPPFGGCFRHELRDFPLNFVSVKKRTFQTHDCSYIDSCLVSTRYYKN